MFSKLTVKNDNDKGMTNCQCLLGFDPLCDKTRDIAIELGLFYVRDDKLTVETSGVNSVTSQIRRTRPMPVSSPTKNGFDKQNFGKPKARKRLFLPPKFKENTFVVKDPVKVEANEIQEEPKSQESAKSPAKSQTMPKKVPKAKNRIRRKQKKLVSPQEMVEYMRVQNELRRLPEADANKKYTQIPLNISFFSVNKTLSEAEASTKPVKVCSQDDPGLSLGGGAKRKQGTSQEL